MHETLQKEIALYEKRTRRSAEAHKKAEQRIPLGAASNYRAYDPYPIFVAEGRGSKIVDIDGNEYIDHNLCFGTLMAGHSHPAVVKAVEWALGHGATFGMPHGMELELADEICARYPVEMVRFGSSGTEATMHACRIARAATGRDKILRFEGAYHGLHDTALVSVKPKEEDFGDIDAPNSVPGGLGVIQAVLERPLDRFDDCRMTVPGHERAKTQVVIDVFVSIDVHDLAATTLRDKDRIRVIGPVIARYPERYALLGLLVRLRRFGRALLVQGNFLL